MTYVVGAAGEGIWQVTAVLYFTTRQESHDEYRGVFCFSHMSIRIGDFLSVQIVKVNKPTFMNHLLTSWYIELLLGMIGGD